jgi:hypothetical protein
MATKLNDGDFNCYRIGEDDAVISIRNQNYVLDYSTLIDILTTLATAASQMEKLIQTPNNSIPKLHS